MIAVRQAKYLAEYRLWIQFNTGEAGEVDLADLIHRYPAAKAIRDPQEFAKFYLDEWPTIAWSCGFDLSPEALYERATGKTFEYVTVSRSISAAA